ncbi:MAG TPA: GyrI-like domain-containing protein, partial [Mucilaginibacter sp.]
LLQVVDRLTDEIYCVYTDYESDFTGFYTAILGCRVSSLDNIPEGLISLIVPPGNYVKYTAEGRIPDCIAETWQQIWSSDIRRKYTADFDLYGLKARDSENARVEIYVAI